MRKKHVLVIDDDSSLRDLISLVVMQLGHQVTSSDNFENALIGFSQSKYDLVITDLFMEGMGGIEGINVIRKEHPKVKIIAISAGYDDISGDRALRAAKKMGADIVIAKPIDLDALSDAVSKLLPKKKD